MMKDPKTAQNVTISVFLKDGRSYERKDISSAPLGNNERFVCFWEGDDVIAFPLENVDRFVMHFD